MQYTYNLEKSNTKIIKKSKGKNNSATNMKIKKISKKQQQKLQILEKKQLKSSYDEKIIALVQQYGEGDWILISKLLNHELKPKYIRERYYRNLEHKTNKSKFSDAEDQKILELLEKYGTQWKKIAFCFNDRNSIQIKNHFYSSLLKKLEKNQKDKCNEYSQYFYLLPKYFNQKNKEFNKNVIKRQIVVEKEITVKEVDIQERNDDDDFMNEDEEQFFNYYLNTQEYEQWNMVQKECVSLQNADTTTTKTTKSHGNEIVKQEEYGSIDFTSAIIDESDEEQDEENYSVTLKQEQQSPSQNCYYSLENYLKDVQEQNHNSKWNSNNCDYNKILFQDNIPQQNLKISQEQEQFENSQLQQTNIKIESQQQNQNYQFEDIQQFYNNASNQNYSYDNNNNNFQQQQQQQQQQPLQHNSFLNFNNNNTNAIIDQCFDNEYFNYITSFNNQQYDIISQFNSF